MIIMTASALSLCQRRKSITENATATAQIVRHIMATDMAVGIMAITILTAVSSVAIAEAGSRI
jgi:hypothetical protein